MALKNRPEVVDKLEKAHRAYRAYRAGLRSRTAPAAEVGQLGDKFDDASRDATSNEWRSASARVFRER